jgi:hypothetical protein
MRTDDRFRLDDYQRILPARPGGPPPAKARMTPPRFNSGLPLLNGSSYSSDVTKRWALAGLDIARSKLVLSEIARLT